MRNDGVVGLWIPRWIAEDYFDVVTRVLPLRDTQISTQNQIIRRMESIRANEALQTQIRLRMISDLQGMLAGYGEEIAVREQIERSMSREVGMRKMWRGVAVVSVAFALGAIAGR
jgi:hypothetical protein